AEDGIRDFHVTGVQTCALPISGGPGKIRSCPRCSQDAVRVYYAPPVHYHAQGFHTTDYDKTGDRLEKMNKTWSKQFGEAPPPMEIGRASCRERVWIEGVART